jgi:hypothetical protein
MSSEQYCSFAFFQGFPKNIFSLEDNPPTEFLLSQTRGGEKLQKILDKKAKVTSADVTNFVFGLLRREGKAQIGERNPSEFPGDKINEVSQENA